jgi:hypothetical protein
LIRCRPRRLDVRRTYHGAAACRRRTWLLPMNLRFRREERAERREGNPPRPPTLARARPGSWLQFTRARPGSWLQFTPKSLWGSVLSMNRPFAVWNAEVEGRVGRASVSRAANGSRPRFASILWRFPLPMNLRFRREERGESSSSSDSCSCPTGFKGTGHEPMRRWLPMNRIWRVETRPTRSWTEWKPSLRLFFRGNPALHCDRHGEDSV